MILTISILTFLFLFLFKSRENLAMAIYCGLLPFAMYFEQTALFGQSIAVEFYLISITTLILACSFGIKHYKDISFQLKNAAPILLFLGLSSIQSYLAYLICIFGLYLIFCHNQYVKLEKPLYDYWPLYLLSISFIQITIEYGLPSIGYEKTVIVGLLVIGIFHNLLLQRLESFLICMAISLLAINVFDLKISATITVWIFLNMIVFLKLNKDIRNKVETHWKHYKKLKDICIFWELKTNLKQMDLNRALVKKEEGEQNSKSLFLAHDIENIQLINLKVLVFIAAFVLFVTLGSF